MLKNILLGIVTLAIVMASGAYTYTTINSYTSQQRFFEEQAQARRECADKYRAEEYILKECFASRGFNQ